ncbi:MAG: TRAP transporter small permease [Rhizobiaceae bacterium]|nr:TRAP transporter small permease [Rhizobiaceae bacterium]
MSYIRSVNRVVDAALVLSLLVISVSLVAQVALRYLAHSPLPWPEELSQFLLVAISFFGMYRAFENSEHISLKWLPRDGLGQRYLRAAGLACVMVFLIYIGWGGWKLAQTAWHQPSTALRLPMAIPYLVIPISCALSLATVAVTVWRVLTGSETNPPQKDGAA